MILEAVITTTEANGDTHISPMGPWVDAALCDFRLKPYKSSHTWHNLRERPEGVVHVTDDVLLLARALLDQWPQPPALTPAARVAARRLADCCRYWEFEVATIEDHPERPTLHLRIVHQASLRDFWGFNRAKHAVLEAAILASRIDRLPREAILSEYEKLAVLVAKTGGEAEREAFELFDSFVRTSPGPSGTCP